MAWTVTVNQKSVFGNMRVYILSCLADAATQTVVTPLQNVYGFSIAPQSMTTGWGKLYANSGAAGTSIAGVIGCSGFTSGDQFFLIVYGR